MLDHLTDEQRREYDRIRRFEYWMLGLMVICAGFLRFHENFRATTATWVTFGIMAAVILAVMFCDDVAETYLKR
jgi:hypothetical protein